MDAYASIIFFVFMVVRIGVGCGINSVRQAFGEVNGYVR